MGATLRVFVIIVGLFACAAFSLARAGLFPKGPILRTLVLAICRFGGEEYNKLGRLVLGPMCGE